MIRMLFAGRALPLWMSTDGIGRVRRLMPAALLACVTGCSLVSIKSPEKPLSPRDLDARIRAHAFASRFDLAVEQTADEITAGTGDGAVQLNALRWKIAATGASERAASQVVPMLGLLDLWALTDQMHAFLAEGNGRALFGAQQSRAVALAADLELEAQDIARESLAPGEFEADKRFVENFAQGNPLEGLGFARAAIVDRWARERGGSGPLVESLGTVPEAVADATDVMRMYGDTLTSQALWRAELAAHESGIDGRYLESALERLDGRFARLSAMADSTPGMMNGLVRDMSKRMENSWVEMMGTIRAERMALSSTVSAERQAAVDAVDKERAALDADASRLAAQMISDAGREVRLLVREALLLCVGAALIVLALPFAAGYFLGRARSRS